MAPDDERFELASLGDLMELLIEGWRIAGMHYADRCEASGPPAAFFRLVRGPGEHRGVYVPDDARALSHRALVSLFRESPRIWKHRSPDSIAASPDEPAPRDGWGEVPEPFPQALEFAPSTLREVVPVNQVQSVEGLTIALTVLERHRDAARVRYMCQAGDEGRPRDVSMLDVIAVDDEARLYRVAPADQHAGGGRHEGVLVVAPAIPREAARLTVTIGTALDVWTGEERLSGPWVFPIPLTR